jgi:phosphoribosyl 1,2-cyclic phosphate phosphodiesterase
VTDIYLPQQVAQDFRHWLGSWEHLAHLRQIGVARLHELKDGDAVTLNGVTIRPFRLAEDYVYAFIFEEGRRRVLIAPDELFGWTPPDLARGVDLAVIPMGVVEFDPLTGARRIAADHRVLAFEATFRQTLEMVRQMSAQRVIMTHIEEPDGQSYDDLLRLEDKLAAEGFHITFAYDTMMIEV